MAPGETPNDFAASLEDYEIRPGSPAPEEAISSHAEEATAPMEARAAVSTLRWTLSECDRGRTAREGVTWMEPTLPGGCWDLCEC